MKITKPVVSSEILILIVSIYIASICNLTFWRELSARLDITSLEGFAYLFTSFFVILFLISFILYIFSQKLLIKPVLVFAILFSATISYFNYELGVIFDKEMVRNIIETIHDHNINEAEELLSYPLFLTIFILGVIPSILVSLVTIKHDKPFRSYINRGMFAACILLIAASTFIMNYKFYTFFYRQNEDLLVYITPIYPLVAVKKYVKRQIKNSSVFNEIGNDAKQIKKDKRKTVGIMVIGETARADRFSLNGYYRQTNPILSKNKKIINFTHVHSCGTTTAYSVPCMFSFLDHNNYSPEKAQQSSNVLDVLTKSGVKVTWGENNSSCKGICNRIEEINFIGHPDKNSKSEHNGQNYDEVMMESFNKIINKTDGDVLFVLHTIGSHGPQYHNRYPDSSAVFKPYCEKASPQECDKEEINNAYDNTIIYTDYFLSLIVSYLEQHKNNYDSFMMYESDHGESLGENGIYLHGLPYFLAPEAQTHVPFLMWMSDNFVTDNNLDLNNIKQETNLEYTHDNLVHTLLGLFSIQTRLYDQSLDIIHPEKILNNQFLKNSNEDLNLFVR